MAQRRSPSRLGPSRRPAAVMEKRAVSLRVAVQSRKSLILDALDGPSVTHTSMSACVQLAMSRSGLRGNP